MKKLLALTLALTMALSLGAVAFADGNHTFEVEETVYVEGDDDNLVELEGNAAFDDSVYLEIEFDGGDLVDSDDAKKLHVKSEFTSGADYVDSVSLTKKKIDGSAHYVIEIALKEMPKLAKAKDVIGEITVKGSSKYTTTAGEKEQVVQVAFSACNPVAGEEGNPSKNETADDNYIYRDFDEDEEYELELYGDMGTFVVDTYGQGKLVINTDVEYNKGIEAIDPDVNYVYFNGNNATFNKIGVLTLKADKNEFVYKVKADGTLVKVDAPYDEDEEGFAIRTRVIGSYVISEKELNLEEINAGVVEAPEAEVAPSNPSTGAAC